MYLIVCMVAEGEPKARHFRRAVESSLSEIKVARESAESYSWIQDILLLDILFLRMDFAFRKWKLSCFRYTALDLER